MARTETKTKTPPAKTAGRAATTPAAKARKKAAEAPPPPPPPAPQAEGHQVDGVKVKPAKIPQPRRRPARHRSRPSRALAGAAELTVKMRLERLKREVLDTETLTYCY